jgi:HPt (histidine-containing phosphotransfer) domain-containing protein
MDQPNMHYIDQLSGGDVEFEKKFIGILKSEFPEELLSYLDSIKKKDAKTAADLVHKIKHKFSILSMSESYELAVVYETALRKGNFDHHKQFLTILEQVRDFINQL